MSHRTIQILDGPRLDLDHNSEMNTSIEASLPTLHKNHSNNSNSSSPDSLYFLTPEKGGCKHKKLLSQAKYDNCSHCGVFVPKNGVKIYKSKKMDYAASFPPKTIYETLTKRSPSFHEALNPKYSQIRTENVEWMMRLASSLKISANSAHLGALLLDITMFKDKTLISKIQLFVPVCLLLAAKTIELDQNIPFIPKLRDYAKSTYSTDAFKKAELHVMDLLDWNSQFSSALEIFEFLMCQGILFSTDEINESKEIAANGSPVDNKNSADHRNKAAKQAETQLSVGKYLSPDPKENKENSYSDASTNGTSPDPFRSPTALQVGDLSSMKKKSDDVRYSVPKDRIPMERRVGTILSFFEANYVSLCETLVKDLEFIQYEPKIVAAASVAFLRRVNRITTVWNNELETITNLKYLEISSCFELIQKKYHSRFQQRTPFSDYSSQKKTTRPPLNLTKAHSMNTDALDTYSSKHNLSIKTNLINKDTIHLGSGNSSELKPVYERKSIFNNPSSATLTSTYNTYLPNHYNSNLNKGKYGVGTVNAEAPRKCPLRNKLFSSNNPFSTKNQYPLIDTRNTGFNKGSYLDGTRRYDVYHESSYTSQSRNPY